jgi:POT family proton-dependent oligopeptide transporter
MNSESTFMGHPRGLATLFFTEMFERFSYYGMRALLLIFITTSLVDGGMGIGDTEGGAIYGLYVMGVYVFALPGGWIADRLFGLKRSVWYGGIIIALGHFTMAIPGVVNLISGVSVKTELTQMDTIPFYLGLILIALGTGLLKPNISSMVGSMYAKTESAKRDAGFSIFYSGINIGAFIAPLITSPIGEQVDWHLGFGMAGLFMVFGLIQYRLTLSNLDGIGDPPVFETGEEVRQKNKLVGGLRIAFIAVVGSLSVS